MPGLGQTSGFGTPSLPATHTTDTANRDSNDEREGVGLIVTVPRLVPSFTGGMQSGMHGWNVYAVAWLAMDHVDPTPPPTQTVATGVPPIPSDDPPDVVDVVPVRMV